MRKLVTVANEKSQISSTHGMALHDGYLHVNSHRGVSKVSTKSGKITQTFLNGRMHSGLDFDGKTFVGGASNPSALVFLKSNGVEKGRIIAPGKIGRAAFHDGYVLCTVINELGYDVDHNRIRIWPSKAQIYKIKMPKLTTNSNDKKRSPRAFGSRTSGGRF